METGNCSHSNVRLHLMHEDTHCVSITLPELMLIKNKFVVSVSMNFWLKMLENIAITHVFFFFFMNINECFTVSGVCYDLNASTHTITYNVEECGTNSYPLGYSYTGFQSPFWILVEELRFDARVVCSSNNTAAR